MQEARAVPMCAKQQTKPRPRERLQGAQKLLLAWTLPMGQKGQSQVEDQSV